MIRALTRLAARSCLPIIEANAVCANTHPTNDPSGVSRNESKIRHVFRDHGPGADECIPSDCYATNDGAVGAESRAAANQGRTQFIHPPDLAAGVEHVGE